MELHNNSHLQAPAPMSTPAKAATAQNPIPSSSPAFATPAGPIRPPAPPTTIPAAAAAAAGRGTTNITEGGANTTAKNVPITNSGPQGPLTAAFPRFNISAGTLGADGAAGANGDAAAAAAAAAATTTILPVLIPAATLRPLAFRVFTKRHNLTLQSSALATLATFIGRHCGSRWRDEGLAEKVLEEAAKRWKRAGGALLVEGGDGSELANLLRELGAGMSGGRLWQQQQQQNSGVNGTGLSATSATASGSTLNRQDSFGVSRMSLETNGTQEEPSAGTASGLSAESNVDIRRRIGDVRQYVQVIGAFDQPRLSYNPDKRHFEKVSRPATLFPDASTRTAFFKQRHHMVHQRLMRNESFQAPTSVAVRRQPVPSLQRSASSFMSQQSYKLSNITDLLGRNGSGHILLGLLTVAPAGHYAISDLTGSIMLDLSLAVPTPDWAWVVPGMMVIVDGTYEEDGGGGGINGSSGGGMTGGSLVGSNTGIGGTIGGRFIASTIAGPPSERRDKTLGVISASTNSTTAAGNEHDDFASASGFGWVDFLGVGSEKTVGAQMRSMEQQFRDTEAPGARGRVILLGELNLDVPETFEALRKILGLYESSEPGSTPMTFILMGNFVSTAGMARTGTAGSIEYKESFDLLASTLSDFSRLISSSTFVFVPGDNDPWASTFSASASTPLPRQAIPATLTSRIRRVFQAARQDREKTTGASLEGTAVFTTNPTRISIFGTAQEIVVLRDDMTGRVRRSVVAFDSQQDEDMDEDEDVDEDVNVLTHNNNESDEMPLDNDSMETSGQPQVQQQQRQRHRQQQRKISDGDIKTARQLVKMIVDQSYLTPFSILTRPVLWDYASALHMTPLPTAMILMDCDAPPFALGYGGCFVMNPSRCLVENRKGQARWIEFDAVTKRGKTMQISF